MYKVNAFGCPETPEDWKAAAAEAAERLSAHRFSTHQGAVPWWRPGVIVAFSNRGYADTEEGPAAVTLLRQKLEDEGLAELGFGLDYEGCTWAMLVGPLSMTGMPADEPHASQSVGDTVLSFKLACLVTEAVRIAKGVGFDEADPMWEMYKKAQGLLEPRDVGEFEDDEATEGFDGLEDDEDDEDDEDEEDEEWKQGGDN